MAEDSEAAGPESPGIAGVGDLVKSLLDEDPAGEIPDAATWERHLRTALEAAGILEVEAELARALAEQDAAMGMGGEGGEAL